MLPAPRPCGIIGGANIDLFVGGMVAYVFEEVEGVDDGVEVGEKVGSGDDKGG